MSDDAGAGAATPAQPPTTSEPAKQTVVYPTIGTEKVTENGKKPGGNTFTRETGR
ncbi:hypothetical protein JOF56_004168 [Kibdelosporangium banguiense]|uniref:Uncharacterized protein n=1 Tax=Kibdelosporangium banguiense TaxID=1365924 RepID=A0ABS4TIS1_9PSEU|nr:hypothetical protein [Kibdelosporangium banguiense]MBP2323783.1 hypothetical protein [Kibdelosporangium banguiense]